MGSCHSRLCFGSEYFSLCVLRLGPGAGGDATASAVLGDIADIAKSRPGAQTVPALGRPAKKSSHLPSREGAHVDIVNPYHADFDVSNSLCR